jgi:hypothetical protein
MSKASVQDPRGEYLRRATARRAAAAQLERLDLRIGIFRLTVFISALVIAWLAFRSALLSCLWLALPLLGFLILLSMHERVRRAHRRMDRAAAFYDRGVARLDNHWAGTGETGERFNNKSHAYAEDLDLFGKGSLYELLCTARTRAGEETLASWLKSSAAPEVIQARQTAVEELRGRLDLREDLATLGPDAVAGVNPGALAAWGNEPSLLDSPRVPIAAAVLAFSAVAALAMWLAYDVRIEIFLGLFLTEMVIAYCLRKKIRHVLEAVEHPGQDLALFSQVLHRLEQQRFTAPRLEELRSGLDVEGLPPSRLIARLDLFINLQKQLFAPIAALLLWNIQMAFAIENWRKRSGPSVGRWLEVVGEIEALCALAGYAYEHPDDPFPEIEANGTCFEGNGLGHPLLSEGACIRNDVKLSGDLRVLVVSGSNMSGKSTLLRTVGANAVLALAGAPVRASQLKISPVAVGASIQRRDSLIDGTSRFYAEVTRLKQLLDITNGQRTLLFLLDELLHGTNSHDRRIGAEALAIDLVRRGAIGMLTTHDLALAHIVESLAPRAANVHFEDFVKDGKLVFDYRLRPGVVQGSNALEIMRFVGLHV